MPKALETQIDDNAIRLFRQDLGSWPLRSLNAGRVALAKGLRKVLANIIKLRLSEPYKRGGSTGDKLMRRSGTLARSGFTSAERDGTQSLIGKVKFDAAYARQQEYGGQIRAKPGRALAVPLEDAPARGPFLIGGALTAAGVLRGGPRTFGNTFILKTPHAAYIAQKVFKGFTGKRGRQFSVSGGAAAVTQEAGKVRLLFKLLKSVTLRPKMFVHKQLILDLPALKAFVIQEMGGALAKGWKH